MASDGRDSIFRSIESASVHHRIDRASLNWDHKLRPFVPSHLSCLSTALEALADVAERKFQIPASLSQAKYSTLALEGNVDYTLRMVVWFAPAVLEAISRWQSSCMPYPVNCLEKKILSCIFSTSIAKLWMYRQMVRLLPNLKKNVYFWEDFVYRSRMVEGPERSHDRPRLCIRWKFTIRSDVRHETNSSTRTAVKNSALFHYFLPGSSRQVALDSIRMIPKSILEPIIPIWATDHICMWHVWYCPYGQRNPIMNAFRVVFYW